MGGNKTVKTGASVDEFLAGVDERRRADALAVKELLEKETGRPAEMWGPSIVGFGDRRLRYETGRELDWFEVGFSPRKQALTLYLTDGFDGYDDLLARLGPHSTGRSCLYLKRLQDVDFGVLTTMVRRSVDDVRGGG